jgi:hypothetical protein
VTRLGRKKNYKKQGHQRILVKILKRLSFSSFYYGTCALQKSSSFPFDPCSSFSSSSSFTRTSVLHLLALRFTLQPKAPDEKLVFPREEEEEEEFGRQERARARARNRQISELRYMYNYTYISLIFDTAMLEAQTASLAC